MASDAEKALREAKEAALYWVDDSKECDCEKCGMKRDSVTDPIDRLARAAYLAGGHDEAHGNKQPKWLPAPTTEPKPERCPTCRAYEPSSPSGQCWADMMNGKKPDSFHDSVKPAYLKRWPHTHAGTDCFDNECRVKSDEVKPKRQR